MRRPSVPTLLRTSAVVVVTGLALFASVSRAPAQETPSDISELTSEEKQRVQQHVEAGKTAYDDGNFEKSLYEFQQAFDLLRHPDFMYRIALAHDRLGHLEEAVSSYRQFLRMAPEAEERPQIERTIQELEERLQKTSPVVEVDTQPSGADVFVDDEKQPRGVTDIELEVEPGKHELLVLKDGFAPFEQTVTIERGQTVTIDVDLEPRAPPETEKGDGQAVSAGPSVPVGPIVLFSLSAASAIATTIGGLRYHQLNNDADRLRQEGKREEFDRVATRTNTWRNIALTTGAVTIITAGTAILWLELRSTTGARTSAGLEPRLAPFATTDGAGVVVRF